MPRPGNKTARAALCAALATIISLSGCALGSTTFPEGAVVADAPKLSLEAASNFTIPVEVNGHVLRLRVDPETSAYVILNPEAVARIGLARSMIRSETRVGPVRLTGHSKSATVKVAGVEMRKRIVWLDRPAVEGADGLIGPAELPFSEVTFNLGPATGREVEFELPMDYDAFGLFFPFPVDDEVVKVQFTTMRPFSMATAAAGAVLASAHQGIWSGEARAQLIRYGISRPVRPMQLQRAISLRGLEVGRFLVRTSDNRGGYELPSDPTSDPDEIVVSARSGTRQQPSLVLSVAKDRLSTCSSLSYRAARQTIVLRCRHPE